MSEQSDRFRRIHFYGLIAAGLGAVLSIAAVIFESERFLHSYLFSFCYWTGIGAGCMALLMLQYLAGGRWGLLLRRIFEAAALTLPLMFLLSIPILLCMKHLYSWSLPGALDEPKAHHKVAYLNPLFFTLRLIFYFVVWIVLAVLLRRGSVNSDKARNGADLKRLSALSGPGLIAYVITTSFAAIDWTMSLEPEWYSTIYGMLVIVGQGLSGMALAVVVARLFIHMAPLNREVTPGDFNDFGNLLLMFVMLNAYMSFSQFLVIWSGNLPEEAIWYVKRSRGGWQWIAAALAALDFLVPFVILLFREAKRNAIMLARVSLLLLAAHLLQTYWLVIPTFEPAAIPHLSDASAPLLIGGIWTIVFCRVLRQAPLLPATAAVAPHPEPPLPEAAR
jgi:hypothetical protein